jgi:phage terminase small subunit
VADNRQIKLTRLQAAFLREYLICRNASQAMRKAGYKSKNPDVDSHQLMKNKLIAAAIAEHEKKAQEKFEITHERILKELAKVAFDDEQDVDIGDMMDWDAGSVSMIPKDIMAKKAIRQIKSLKEVIGKDGSRGIALEVKNYDKVKALKLLGDHVGLWKHSLPDDEGTGNKSGTGSEPRKAVLGRLQELLLKPRD